MFSLASSAAALGVACGGDDGIDPNAPEGVSDEEYLAVICLGLQQFSTALVGTADAAEIQDIIAGYITSMEAVVPPRDASEFHAEYIEFLEQARAEPLALVAAQPPLPPASVRQRFVAAEREVEACRTPTFFAAETTALGSPSP
jgi:hypothetical protein